MKLSSSLSFPQSFALNIDEIRTIGTHQYKWYFSTHGNTNKRWIGIRKLRGRLAAWEHTGGAAVEEWSRLCWITIASRITS